jgi:hypothetical protein
MGEGEKVDRSRARRLASLPGQREQWLSPYNRFLSSKKLKSLPDSSRHTIPQRIFEKQEPIITLESTTRKARSAHYTRKPLEAFPLPVFSSVQGT